MRADHDAGFAAILTSIQLQAVAVLVSFLAVYAVIVSLIEFALSVECWHLPAASGVPASSNNAAFFLEYASGVLMGGR